MKYAEWNNKKQAEFNKLPIKFAFSQEQFNRILEEFGLNEDNCVEKLTRVSSGSYMLKEEVYLLDNLLSQHEKEFEELLKDDEFVYDMFIYELGNHEYQICEDDEDVINGCGLKISQINNDKRLLSLYNKAKKEYWKMCLDNDWF